MTYTLGMAQIFGLGFVIGVGIGAGVMFVEGVSQIIKRLMKT